MSQDNEQQLDERFNPFKSRTNKYTNLRHTIAIVSGKGGVGKSTVTSLLANALNRQGLNIGILDADITGPSIGHAFAIHSKASGSDLGIIPANSSMGIKIVSTNMLLDNDDTPVLWRGPMIANAVKEFYTGVLWGDLDYLLIDMPPGTGDVALTVYQSIPIDGIVVVTTPQDMVSMIVSKAIKMAEQMNVPVLGIVENMSYMVCDHCENKLYPFGKGNVEELAELHHVEVLGQIPINPSVNQEMDAGRIEVIESSEMDALATRIQFKVNA